MHEQPHRAQARAASSATQQATRLSNRGRRGLAALRCRGAGLAASPPPSGPVAGRWGLGLSAGHARAAPSD